jgi:AhpD family alkylhydroperoxidase
MSVTGGEKNMEARIKNIAFINPDATKAMQAAAAAVYKGGVAPRILGLVHLRASQINGCAFCVDMGWRQMKKEGETDERIFSVAAWREAPYFDEPERAALALAESATRLSDQSDPVPDAVWNEAAKHYDEPQLASIVLMIALTNAWNRLNVTTRQPANSMKW